MPWQTLTKIRFTCSDLGSWVVRKKISSCINLLSWHMSLTTIASFLRNQWHSRPAGLTAPGQYHQHSEHSTQAPRLSQNWYSACNSCTLPSTARYIATVYSTRFGRTGRSANLKLVSSVTLAAETLRYRPCSFLMSLESLFLIHVIILACVSIGSRQGSISSDVFGFRIEHLAARRYAFSLRSLENECGNCYQNRLRMPGWQIARSMRVQARC